MKRNILLIILVLFCLTGCNKKTIDSNEFIKKMKSKGYEIVDISNDTVNEFIKEAYVATKDEKNIDFYIADTKENAASIYNNQYDLYYSEEGNYNEIRKDNYTSYSKTYAGNYIYFCQIDNTVLVARSSEDNKKDIEKIINKLGY